MMASSRGRDRSSPWDGRGFGRIGCLLHQAEEHAIMNRAETEDGSYASGRNRKLLAEWAAKAGENEYAEPALNPCQTTAYAFFTGDEVELRAVGGQFGAELVEHLDRGAVGIALGLDHQRRNGADQDRLGDTRPWGWPNRATYRATSPPPVEWPMWR